MFFERRQYNYSIKELPDQGRLFIEPSSCAAFAGPARIGRAKECRAYLEEKGLESGMEHASHIVWATGGSLVPESVRAEYVKKSEEAAGHQGH